MSFNSKGFRQKKSLGQVFLKVHWPIQKIVEHIQAKGVTRVLEIGPGGGVLTKDMVEAGLKVTSVEKDDRLIERLKDYFYLSLGVSPDKFELVHQDVLKFDLGAWLAKSQEPTLIVGNIPYNISSPILMWLMPHLEKVAGACFLVQLEFGQRLSSHPSQKSYGSLSVFAQLRARVELLFKVDRTCFQPIPKVDSAVVALEGRTDQLDPKLLQKVELLTRTAFTQRRKMLRNGASQFLGADGEEGCPIDLNRRPDSLSPEEFVDFARHLFFRS